MSIAKLCRNVSNLKSAIMINDRGIKTVHVCDSIIIFAFFLLGVAVVVLGYHFFPNAVQDAGRRLALQALILPAAVALFCGSTVFGRYLIPSASFVFGAALSLLAFQLWPMQQEGVTLLPFLAFVLLAVPVFFLLCVLGMRNATTLMHALRMAGRRELRETLIAFLFRAALFALLVLCFPSSWHFI